jgi:hypothetical protein
MRIDDQHDVRGGADAGDERIADRAFERLPSRRIPFPCLCDYDDTFCAGRGVGGTKCRDRARSDSRDA